MEFLIVCIIFVCFLALGDTIRESLKVKNNNYNEKEYKLYHNREDE